MDDRKSTYELGRDPKPREPLKKLHELPKDTRIVIKKTSEIRDVYYNPKEFRQNPLSGQSSPNCGNLQPSKEVNSSTAWATWLIVLIVVVTTGFIIKKAGL